MWKLRHLRFEAANRYEREECTLDHTSRTEYPDEIIFHCQSKCQSWKRIVFKDPRNFMYTFKFCDTPMLREVLTFTWQGPKHLTPQGLPLSNENSKS